ncbi:MAG: FlgD immunoglobulin-like domain containing protein [Candidatus Latescibacteria bacterium]|jgi:flagellar hook assembly protein FlgD|nr:FlgD immunoglobulin-like domain containing protein [Candidatus Latescibacterota bacterium]
MPFPRLSLAVSLTAILVASVHGEWIKITRPRDWGYFGKSIAIDGNNIVIAENGGGYVYSEEPEGSSSVVDAVSLGSNHPNPFNGSTTIDFDLAATEPISVVIHNMLRQHVRTLVDGTLPAGRQSLVWDGTDDDGRFANSGVYIFTLRKSTTTHWRRMVLLR